MKRVFTLALLFVAAISLSAQSYINVGQFNLRYDTKKDVPRGDGWAARSQHVFDFAPRTKSKRSCAGYPNSAAKQRS